MKQTSQLRLTLCQTVPSKAGWNGVDLQEVTEEVAQVEICMQDGGVAPKVIVDAAQVKVMGEGVDMNQVLVLLTLINKQQLHLWGDRMTTGQLFICP